MEYSHGETIKLWCGFEGETNIEQFDFLKEYSTRCDTDMSQGIRDYVDELEK